MRSSSLVVDGRLWHSRLRAYRTHVAHGLQPRRLPTAYPQVRSRPARVGDTGFEPVTSSVSGMGTGFTQVRWCTDFLRLQASSQRRTLANLAVSDLVGVR